MHYLLGAVIGKSPEIFELDIPLHTIVKISLEKYLFGWGKTGSWNYPTEWTTNMYFYLVSHRKPVQYTEMLKGR